MLITSPRDFHSVDTSDFVDILKQLKGNQYRHVSGGFTNALRGIVTLANGASVFAKHAEREPLASALRKEAALYSYLNSAGFPHCPRLLGFEGDTLVLPDLSGLDWSPHWTKRKLDAVMAAAQSVGELNPPDDLRPLLAHTIGSVLENSWKKLLHDDVWKTVLEKADELAPDGHNLTDITDAARRRAADLVKSSAFDRDTLVHLDVRSDNTAYDPKTGQVFLLDWNWAELCSADLDRTAFLISVFLEPPENLSADIDPQVYLKRVDALSALALAGYWCLSFPSSSQESSDWRELERYKFRSACLAWKLAEL